MKQVEKEEEAYRLGELAYKENRPCVPCLDPQLMVLLTGLEPGQGASKIMQAWRQAYTKLMLTPQ